MLGKMVVGVGQKDSHKGKGDQWECDGAGGEQDEEVVCTPREERCESSKEQGTQSKCGQGKGSGCSARFGEVERRWSGSTLAAEVRPEGRPTGLDRCCECRAAPSTGEEREYTDQGHTVCSGTSLVS